ncbi:Gar1/Naf1 RNA binding region-domain-containing protein [Catenaria anguillulae PL171]|uniref:H/ACA ribonucleoprotein complex non-core subunit NAF1 n=1 Tax=Catenaria anguillulae PL171 TaxID=765915 RepID=A0A1Y2I3S8_9FUNG|nr:Gar1/Naf1 RNA binding region-domain-containing protein [Catenaria anguillulae PL171]
MDTDSHHQPAQPLAATPAAAPAIQEGEIQIDLDLDMDLDDAAPPAQASSTDASSPEPAPVSAAISSPSSSASDASSSDDVGNSDSDDGTSSEDDSDEDEDNDDEDDDDFLRAISGMDPDADDDEADPSSKPGEVLRTANEIATPEIAPVDNVVITPDMPLEVAGHVHMIVQDQVIILSSQPGDQRVLDDGTVLVFDDRTVLGRLFETFGPVAKPMFSVRFASPAQINKERVVKGKTVYYVPDLSVWALTDQLRQMRGCDASNAFDEEVGDKEMEFSDDEEEARWKKQVKAAKSGRNIAQYENNDMASPRKRARGQHHLAYNNDDGETFDYGYDVSGVGRGRGGRHPPIMRQQVHVPATAPRPPQQAGPSIDDLFSRYTSSTPSSSAAPSAPAPAVKHEFQSQPPRHQQQPQQPHHQQPRHTQSHHQQHNRQQHHSNSSPSTSSMAPRSPPAPVIKHERPPPKLVGPPVNAQSLFTNTAPVSHLGRVPPPVGGPAPPAAGFAQLASFTGGAPARAIAGLPPRPREMPQPPPQQPQPQSQRPAPSIWSSVSAPAPPSIASPTPPAVPAAIQQAAPVPAPAVAAASGATDPNLVQLLQTMQAMQAVQSQLVAQLVGLGSTPNVANAAGAAGVPDLSALLASVAGGAGAFGSLVGQQQQPQQQGVQAPPPPPPAQQQPQQPPQLQGQGGPGSIWKM